MVGPRQLAQHERDQANAKLVFRVSLVRDASGSRLYLMKQHGRRGRASLERRGE